MSNRLMPRRMRPLSARRSAILCVLDIGTSKIACLIAKLNPAEASDTLPGRTHRCRILGIGHQRSRGIKGGAVVDMEEAENAIRLAVDAAERMAGVEVGSVIVNITGGRLSSQHYNAKVAVGGKAVSDYDVHRVLEASCATMARQGRAVLHSLPTGFSLDRNALDPRSQGHDRRRTRGRHACRGLRRRRGPQPDAGDRALPPPGRRAGGDTLFGRIVRPGGRRGRTRRRPHRHGRRHYPRSGSSRAGTSPMSMPWRSAATTSPPTSPAASPRGSATPSG